MIEGHLNDCRLLTLVRTEMGRMGLKDLTDLEESEKILPHEPVPLDCVITTDGKADVLI